MFDRHAKGRCAERWKPFRRLVVGNLDGVFANAGTPAVRSVGLAWLHHPTCR